MKRYSEKRAAILECLHSTTSHPTAEWIFDKLRPKYPRLSLATVYRNLAELKAEGVIRSVGVINGQERFDGTLSEHTHAVCSVCGKVIDIDGIDVPDELKDKIAALTGYSVERADLRFSGICGDCIKKVNKE